MMMVEVGCIGVGQTKGQVMCSSVHIDGTHSD